MTARAAAVRIGIVGCGRAAATLHLPVLLGVRGAEVVGLADSDADRVRALASSSGASAYGDYRLLVADPRVDLVAVCVPATLHAEVAIAALRAGKHVFIEKPLALTLEDCDRLVSEARLAESTGARSVVGFNLRCHRLVRQARSILQSGLLGEIELLRTLWTADWTGAARPPWHARRAQGGGALVEIGAHEADLWRWLLESEVESVHTLSRSAAFDDQTAVLEGRMSSGVLVSAAVGQRTRPHNTVEVFGHRGSLRFSCYHGDSLEVSVAGRSAAGLRARIGALVERAARLPGALAAARHGGDFRASYRHEWEHIVRAVRTGGPMPCTVEDGRRAALVVLAALRSAQEGGAVSPAAQVEVAG